MESLYEYGTWAAALASSVPPLLLISELRCIDCHASVLNISWPEPRSKQCRTPLLHAWTATQKFDFFSTDVYNYTILHFDEHDFDFLLPLSPSVTTVLLGSRAGFWRLHRVLTERDIPVTVYAVGRALEQNPDAGQFLAFIASSFSYFFSFLKTHFSLILLLLLLHRTCNEEGRLGSCVAWIPVDWLPVRTCSSHKHWFIYQLPNYQTKTSTAASKTPPAS